MTYEDLIDRWLYESVPTPDASPATRFEAASAAVLGTKQRRQGPLPPPEMQVLVRDALRAAAGRPIDFFVPWGGSKQDSGAPLDILEFCALRQLRGLSAELAGYGLASRFTFRVEDVTDHFLFDHRRTEQVEDYAADFARLARHVVPNANPVRERDMVSQEAFDRTALQFAPVFYNYFRGAVGPDALEEVGWKGGVPEPQKAHYLKAYQTLYPGEDHFAVLARYFGATLARVKLGATAVPPGAIGVTFAHPVPGDPIRRPRVHYRTIPERYTHQHKAPWLARGYLAIGEAGRVVPRYDEPGLRLTPHAATVGGVAVAVPYAAE